jgi:hypothetical protein
VVVLAFPHLGSGQDLPVSRIQHRLPPEDQAVFRSEDGQEIVVVRPKEVPGSEGVLALAGTCRQVIFAPSCLWVDDAGEGFDLEARLVDRGFAD